MTKTSYFHFKNRKTESLLRCKHETGSLIPPQSGSARGVNDSHSARSPPLLELIARTTDRLRHTHVAIGKYHQSRRMLHVAQESDYAPWAQSLFKPNTNIIDRRGWWLTNRSVLSELARGRCRCLRRRSRTRSAPRKLSKPLGPIDPTDKSTVASYSPLTQLSSKSCGPSFGTHLISLTPNIAGKRAPFNPHRYEHR